MRKIIKLIDYAFQHKSQLEFAYDDSNSMRYLDPHLDIEVIGRLDVKDPMMVEVADIGYSYHVTFLPNGWSTESVADYIELTNPDVIHMHGNHGWPQYPYYAARFRNNVKNVKMIFSFAGASCGTPSFLSHFDHILVNHESQIKRMKVGSEKEYDKVIIRRRCADPNIFYPVDNDPFFDFVYVAAFVPKKRMDEMIGLVEATHYNLVILGDFTRTVIHYNNIKKLIEDRGLVHRIVLNDFIPQTEMAEFLSRCKCFVWPNIKPENPETTANRAIIEALACGKPLLLGERAFNDSEFIVNGYNGFKYSSGMSFIECADRILSNYKFYSGNSIMVNERFSFQENFIDFYNKLYG